jgi:hypothetical protein
VGINATRPYTTLHVDGKLRTTHLQIPDPAPDGSPKEIQGFVLISNDNSGNARWVPQSSIDDGDWVFSGDNVYRPGGKVGIGTDDPKGLLSLFKDNNNENLGISFQNGGSARY